MNPIPIDLPIRPSEASSLAAMLIDEAALRPLGDELRDRLGARAAASGFTGICPHFASLEADPARAGAYYVMADGLASPFSAPEHPPILLHVAPGPDAAPAFFEGAILVGSFDHRQSGRFYVRAVDLSSSSPEALAAACRQITPWAAPKPLGPEPALACGTRHPALDLPAAFQVYRQLLRSSGSNLACAPSVSFAGETVSEDELSGRDPELPFTPGFTGRSPASVLRAGVLSALRSGWRKGYTAHAAHVPLPVDPPSWLGELSGFSLIGIDFQPLIREEADPRIPGSLDDNHIAQAFESLFDDGEQKFFLDEIPAAAARSPKPLTLPAAALRRVAVKYAACLRAVGPMLDALRVGRGGEPFDWELSLDRSSTLTSPEEAFVLLQWLKARGTAPQFFAPNLGLVPGFPYPVSMESTVERGLGLSDYASPRPWPELAPRVLNDFGGKPLMELGARIRDLALVARSAKALLSVPEGDLQHGEVLGEFAHGTAGRLLFRVSADLELTIFDVLFAQPAASAPRSLYNRMAARARDLSATTPDPSPAALAHRQFQLGRGYYPGDPARARTDGNLFLIRHLGELSATRDLNDPDADTRTFGEKIASLPQDLQTEMRRRMAAHLKQIAQLLR